MALFELMVMSPLFVAVRFAQITRQYSLQPVPDDRFQAAVSSMRSIYVDDRLIFSECCCFSFDLLICLMQSTGAEVTLSAGLILYLKLFLFALCNLPWMRSQPSAPHLLDMIFTTQIFPSKPFTAWMCFTCGCQTAISFFRYFWDALQDPAAN